VKSIHDFCRRKSNLVYCNPLKISLLSHLVLVDLTILQFGLALLLKCNDNQGHENVNEEEWKHYEINDVEDGHLDAKVLNWTPVLICCSHRVLKYSGGRGKRGKIVRSFV
jgi:hypothetical protein